MKTTKTAKYAAILASVVGLASASATPTYTLFDNTYPDSDQHVNTVAVPGFQVGDQVVLGQMEGAVGYVINQFSFYFWTQNFANGNETYTFRIYQQDGPVLPGTSINTPGTVLYTYTGTDLANAGTISRDTLLFSSPADFAPINVTGNNITWTLEFGNLTAGESGGIVLYSPANQYGVNHPGMWSGTSAGTDWTLITNATMDLDFAANIQGYSIPEPTTLGFLGLGLGALALALRRRQ